MLLAPQTHSSSRPRAPASERTHMDENVPNGNLASQAAFPGLSKVHQARTLDCHKLSLVTHQKSLLSLHVRNPCQNISFLIIDSSLILGNEWLYVDSTFRFIQACKSSCLVSHVSKLLNSLFLDLPMLPEAYLDLKEVFSKTQTISLPPRGLYDCTIEQLLW